MRRFDLLGHASTKEAVLACVQALGIIHVEDAAPRLETAADAGRPQVEPPPDAAAVEERLRTVQTCLAFIERYAGKPGLLQQLKEPRLRVSQEQFDQTVAQFALGQVADRIRDLEAQLSATRTQATKLEVLREDLAHWTHLDCALEEIGPTATVAVDLAVVDTAAIERLEADLAEASRLVHVHELQRDRPSSYLMIFTAHAVAEAVGPIFKKYGCRTIDFGDLPGTPSAARERLAEEIATLRAKHAALEAEAAGLASDRPPLLMLADYYADAVSAARVEGDMLHTRSAYYLTGWVPAAEEGAFATAVHAVSPAISLELRDPGPDEEPPVQLDNGATEPFEMIANMYGTPQYRSTDATRWFAPWFAGFFGLCLTDAGYGILLVMLAAWAVFALPLGGGARSLVRILFFGGLCTLVAGALTGGWFGIQAAALPAPLRALILLDPMADGVQAFMLSLGIGVVHVFLGVFILMLNNLRRGRTVEALLDQGVWLLFIPCVAVLLYTSMFRGTIESPAVMRLARLGAMLCTVLVVLTGSREGPLVLRPLLGATKLYDVVGYFGDVLSYARLFALGLATGAIAQVTNMIAGDVATSLPFGLGYLVAALILVVGHVMNLLINALGAFIHSMRLQFIEFFGKFFQDGGTPFRPFTAARVHTVVEPG